jgi:hypothetical protein
MDKATIDFITQTTDRQSEHFEKLIGMKDDNDSLKFKAVQKSIDVGLDMIALELRQRNGNIEKMQKELCEVKDHTSWWRFFQRNPKVTAIAVILTLVGSLVLFGIRINEDGIGISLFQHIIEKIF